ncbi:S-adenosyl-L-methionine-dependent methyltransferase [Xylaria cubensis]|nr:S-adenosyl-L-methionine-dependent methyltransferase [Xylaria cubensis]
MIRSFYLYAYGTKVNPRHHSIYTSYLLNTFQTLSVKNITFVMATQIRETPENIKERLKASYDAMASTYNEWTIPHSKQRLEYLEKALEYLGQSTKPEKPAFLELGCGCGLPITKKLLSYPEAKVIANDLSETQIALARENLIQGPEDGVAQRLELIQGDMNGLEFPDGSLDLVVGFYSIIHLPRSEQTTLLGRIAKWLKPGGYFVANFSKEENESAVMEKWLDEDKGWMFWSAWGKEKTLGQMKDAGFDVVVAETADDVVDDSSFLWVVAKR